MYIFGSMLATAPRVALLAGAIALAGVTTSCGSYVPPPEQIPTFQIDALASEVRVTGPGTSDDRAKQFRSAIAWALSDMMRERSDLDDARPARFTAKVEHEIYSWPIAACLGVLIIFACPVGDWSVNVDLVLEVDGKHYRGQGSYSYPAGIFYNQSGTTAMVGATERALDAALSDAQGEKSSDAVAKKTSDRVTP